MKRAKVRVESYRVNCPHCNTEFFNNEDGHNNACVCRPEGVYTCDGCGKKFELPELDFPEVRRFRKPR